jgi:hypothetical protein
MRWMWSSSVSGSAAFISVAIAGLRARKMLRSWRTPSLLVGGGPTPLAPPLLLPRIAMIH